MQLKLEVRENADGSFFINIQHPSDMTKMRICAFLEAAKRKVLEDQRIINGDPHTVQNYISEGY